MKVLRRGAREKSHVGYGERRTPWRFPFDRNNAIEIIRKAKLNFCTVRLSENGRQIIINFQETVESAVP